MSANPAELWAFYLAAAAVAVILVVTAGAAVIVAQRKITAAMRDYAARQVASLEEERGRIARELHDDVSQQIAVLSQRVDHLQEALQGQAKDPTLVHQVISTSDGLQQLAESVRDLAHRMHPSMLDHLGLGPALQGLAGEMADGTGLVIDVDVPDPFTEPKAAEALAFYRVAQESLRNVQKHAEARRVLVLVTQSDLHTSLEISDNGCGFQTERAVRSEGLGLVSMRERMRLVGGELFVSTAPGEGTIVRARIPMVRAEDA